MESAPGPNPEIRQAIWLGMIDDADEAREVGTLWVCSPTIDPDIVRITIDPEGDEPRSCDFSLALPTDLLDTGNEQGEGNITFISPEEHGYVVIELWPDGKKVELILAKRKLQTLLEEISVYTPSGREVATQRSAAVDELLRRLDLDPGEPENL